MIGTSLDALMWFVAYLLLTALSAHRKPVCVHVSVCLSRTLHTASCPRVTHKPFRPTLFPSSAPLHASYTLTSPAHVHTHARKLSSWFTPTLRRRQGLISSPLRLQLAHLHPPFLVRLKSYLFCCLRATAVFWEVVVESPLAWREGTDTHSHKKTKGKICHVSVSLLYCQNCNLTL